MSSNHMGCRPTRAAMLLGAVALLWPALATGATTVQSTYFDSANKTCLSNVSACELVFVPLAAERFLLVQRVSCVLILPNTAKISNLQLRRRPEGGGVTGFQYLAPVQELPDHSGNKHYTVNADALLAMDQNDRPSVVINLRALTSFITITCTVHGTFLPTGV